MENLNKKDEINIDDLTEQQKNNLFTKIVVEFKDTLGVPVLSKEIALEIKDKVDFAKSILSADGCIEMGECAKMLNYKGYGRNKIYELLRDKGILHDRRYSDIHNQPLQSFVDRGYFEVDPILYRDSFEKQRLFCKTKVTTKGIEFIKKLLDKTINEQIDNYEINE